MQTVNEDTRVTENPEDEKSNGSESRDDAKQFLTADGLLYQQFETQPIDKKIEVNLAFPLRIFCCCLE